jgi:threonine aldolase
MVTATNDAPALAQHDIEQEAQHQSNGTAKVNNWSHPGPAAFDFRSMPSLNHHHQLKRQWPTKN